jgi:cell division protein FtsN
MSYDDVKKLIQEHRTPLLVIGGMVALFWVGFGAGHATRQELKQSPNYKQYSTKQDQKDDAEGRTEAPQEKTQEKPQEAVAATGTVAGVKEAPSSAPVSCIVKGNISGKNKIYHVKGGSFYDRVQAEQCFATEAEAQSVGYRKSSR